MKIKYAIGYISIFTAALIFAGCNNSSSNIKTNKVITVERGPLLNSKVVDASGQVAIEIGHGKYAFYKNILYPIQANGGYIDVNYNGKIDAGEIKNTLELRAENGDVITMASTLATNKSLSLILENSFNLSKDDIETKTPKSSKKIEAFSNVVYSFCIQNDLNTSEITKIELEELIQSFEETLNQYQSDGKNVAEHEQEIMDMLPLFPIDDADAQVIQEEIELKYQENKEDYEGFIDDIIGGYKMDTGEDITPPFAQESTTTYYDGEINQEDHDINNPVYGEDGDDIYNEDLDTDSVDNHVPPFAQVSTTTYYDGEINQEDHDINNPVYGEDGDDIYNEDLDTDSGDNHAPPL